MNEVAKPITRAKIMALQEAMMGALSEAGIPFSPGNTDDVCPLAHHFAPGLYAREILIPQGVLIVGKIHKHAHVNTISKGHVLVATEQGLIEFVAPYTFISQPGTKRVVLALSETIWTTYHPTDETDLEKIEDYVIAKTFEEFDALEYERAKLLEGAMQ